jgi:GNAT superfamily N-acetyltransferase
MQNAPDNITFSKLISPVSPEKSWQLESFLLKIFEFGNYSFRRALQSQLSPELQCTFFIAQHNDTIIAAAGAMYDIENPAVALFGPVCADPQYRNLGLGRKLCQLLLDHLQTVNVEAVYLGVSPDNPAMHLYQKIGFEKRAGIVLRKLFVDEQSFNKRYSQRNRQISIQPLKWHHFPEVSAMLCEPADMYTYDFSKGLYSTRYAEPHRFLPVLPEMMSAVEKKAAVYNVLRLDDSKSIVGIASITLSPHGQFGNASMLDFFTLDDFLENANTLIVQTIRQYKLSITGKFFAVALLAMQGK